MKKLLVFLFIVAGLSGFRQSNTRHITGHVFAKDDGLPIPGVSVRIKGANTGVQTATNGKYSIDVPDGNILVYSFVGYTTQEIKIQDKDVIDVYLEASSASLGEVVVTQPLSVQAQAAQYATSPSLDKSVTANTFYRGVPGNVPVQKSKRATNSSKTYVPPSANGDESYKGINENEFNDAKSNPLSTFSVDVDAASYSNVRRFINNGELPPADAVRIEEMINYFKYDLKGPANGDPVAIHTELSSAPWSPKHRLLRIGLKAKMLNTDKLPPSNLVFLIDVSGSMGEPNKLPLVKASMKLLT
jgi:Ca-activated chloride channel family protein